MSDKEQQSGADFALTNFLDEDEASDKNTSEENTQNITSDNDQDEYEYVEVEVKDTPVNDEKTVRLFNRDISKDLLAKIRNVGIVAFIALVFFTVNNNDIEPPGGSDIAAQEITTPTTGDNDTKVNVDNKKSQKVVWEDEAPSVEPPTIEQKKSVNLENLQNQVYNTTGVATDDVKNKLQEAKDKESKENKNRAIALQLGTLKSRLDTIESALNKNTVNKEFISNTASQLTRINNRLTSLEKTTANKPNLRKKTDYRALNSNKPRLEDLSIGRALDCDTCVPHALFTFNNKKMTLANGDNFFTYKATIIGDRLILKNQNEQYSYYPPQ